MTNKQYAALQVKRLRLVDFLELTLDRLEEYFTDEHTQLQVEHVKKALRMALASIRPALGTLEGVSETVVKDMRGQVCMIKNGIEHPMYCIIAGSDGEGAAKVMILGDTIPYKLYSFPLGRLHPVNGQLGIVDN